MKQCMANLAKTPTLTFNGEENSYLKQKMIFTNSSSVCEDISLQFFACEEYVFVETFVREFDK